MRKIKCILNGVVLPLNMMQIISFGKYYARIEISIVSASIAISRWRTHQNIVFAQKFIRSNMKLKFILVQNETHRQVQIYKLIGPCRLAFAIYNDRKIEMLCNGVRCALTQQGADH